MILDGLSNAFYCFSLRRLGAELEGGRVDALPPPPPADHESFGAPAWRGLSKVTK